MGKLIFVMFWYSLSVCAYGVYGEIHKKAMKIAVKLSKVVKNKHFD